MNSFNALLEKIKDEPDSYDLLKILEGFSVHPSIITHYKNLSRDQKNNINNDLKILSKGTQEERYKIFEKMSKNYERFFDWEEVTLSPCP
jgi:hypothetical protein